jgi:hypothetical protein
MEAEVEIWKQRTFFPESLLAAGELSSQIH